MCAKKFPVVWNFCAHGDGLEKCSEMNLTYPPSRYTCERDCWLCRVPSRAFLSCADLEILTYRHISAIYRALQKVAVTREAFEESDTYQ